MFAAGTSQQEFRLLADSRLREARLLFVAGEFDGAYYLGGYSVECALKAVITKSIQATVLIKTDAVYCHDLQKLLGFADLFNDLQNSPAVAQSWTVVRSWSEQSRYKRGTNQATADGLLGAIDDPQTGILPWLKQRW